VTASGSQTNAAAAPTLTVGAAALAGYPGPVVLVDGAGAVEAVGDAAAELAAALRAADPDGAAAPLLAAIRDRRAAVEAITVGGSRAIECTVLPLADGGCLVLGRDVTLDRNLRAALFESRQRYKDLVEISSDFAWEVGVTGKFVFVSPRGALGYPADGLVGRAPGDFVVEQPGDAGMLPFLTDHSVDGAELWMRRADGGLACVIAAAAPLIGPAGEWRGARGVCRDVTNERARDAALARASNRERLLTYIVRTIRDVVDPVDMLAAAAEATARAVGAKGCAVFRTAEPERRDRLVTAAAFGRPCDTGRVVAALAGQDHVEETDAEHRILAAAARYRHGINGAVCVWRDLGDPAWSDDDRLLCDSVATQIGIAIEQIVNHERILMLSRTDALTGLFNRRAFFEELGRRFQRLARDERHAALIYCDLDNFKLVNDAHGHACGDEALLQVRDLLVGSTRPVDLVARLGGDEFAMWLEGADQEIAVARSRALLAASRRLEKYSGDPSLPLHMSLGVAVHDPELPETMEELVARADKAMYRAKRDGKAKFALAPPPAPAEEVTP